MTLHLLIAVLAGVIALHLWWRPWVQRLGGRLLAGFFALIAVGHALASLQGAGVAAPTVLRAGHLLSLSFCGPVLWLATRASLHGHRPSRRDMAIGLAPPVVTLGLISLFGPVAGVVIVTLLTFGLFIALCLRAWMDEGSSVLASGDQRWVTVALILSAAIVVIDLLTAGLALIGRTDIAGHITIATASLAVAALIIALVKLSLSTAPASTPDGVAQPIIETNATVSSRRAPPASKGLSDADRAVMVAIESDFRALLREREMWRTEGLTLSHVARHMHLPRRTLADALNATGEGFRQRIIRFRVAQAKALLSEREELSVTDIIYESGFTTKSAFNRAFKDLTGHTPSQYRRASIAASQNT